MASSNDLFFRVFRNKILRSKILGYLKSKPNYKLLDYEGRRKTKLVYWDDLIADANDILRMNLCHLFVDKFLNDKFFKVSCKNINDFMSRNDDYTLFRRLYDQIPLYFTMTESDYQPQFSKDQLEIMKNVPHKSYLIDQSCMKKNSFQIIEFLLSKGFKFSILSLKNSLISGNLPAVKFFYPKYKWQFKKELLDSAIINMVRFSSVEVFQYLNEHVYALPKIIEKPLLYHAVLRNQFEITKYLIDHNIGIIEVPKIIKPKNDDDDEDEDDEDEDDEDVDDEDEKERELEDEIEEEEDEVEKDDSDLEEMDDQKEETCKRKSIDKESDEGREKKKLKLDNKKREQKKHWKTKDPMPRELLKVDKHKSLLVDISTKFKDSKIFNYFITRDGWLSNIRKTLTSRTLVFAVKFNNREVLNYIHLHYPNLIKKYLITLVHQLSLKIIDSSSKDFCLEILELLLDNYKLKWISLRPLRYLFESGDKKIIQKVIDMKLYQITKNNEAREANNILMSAWESGSLEIIKLFLDSYIGKKARCIIDSSPSKIFLDAFILCKSYHLRDNYRFKITKELWKKKDHPYLKNRIPTVFQPFDFLTNLDFFKIMIKQCTPKTEEKPYYARNYSPTRQCNLETLLYIHDNPNEFKGLSMTTNTLVKLCYGTSDCILELPIEKIKNIRDTVLQLIDKNLTSVLQTRKIIRVLLENADIQTLDTFINHIHSNPKINQNFPFLSNWQNYTPIQPQNIVPLCQYIYSNL
ncbi:PHD zinc finger-containing protein [Tieghemostelium lacteum]|uniref:PHD zinc finger-containing protein n=1 Tax=Tieghemostelium lacteum TaxID=361077 RepID=A0A151Z8S2_TIELA|nr:PHD zinc finger-containing protein [Tieghemostelium lacteum]|eukprot:KYQ90214.1 PHD zinc finger-containing protein [Tieghemostelium lacteum]